MERRTTIRDIAKALGYHHSTISLALRNDARLPQKTRDEVRAAAERMGYRPDPMVQALAVYRTAVKPASDHGTIAWLSNEKTLQFGPHHVFWRYELGAVQRAAELGYRIEEFALKTPGMTPQRMSKILQTRGIVGVLVAPQPMGRIRARIRMDWSPFSAVTIGYSLAWPSMHVVTNHQFSTARLAYRKLISFGYRRVGICIERRLEARCNGGFLGGYLSESSRWPTDVRLEPFIYEDWNTAKTRAWYKRWKPEAIICHDAIDASKMLEELNLRAPEDLGVVSMTETVRPFAHINQQPHLIGRAAIDLIVSIMNHNERGIPDTPRRLLTEGKWVDGPSVARVNMDRRRKTIFPIRL